MIQVSYIGRYILSSPITNNGYEQHTHLQLSMQKSAHNY